MFDKKERAEIVDFRLDNIEKRLKNIEKGRYALEEQSTMPGTLFQLEKALQESCAPLNWPVEKELNADNFQNHLLFIIEAIGRSLLALHKRLSICEENRNNGGQISFRKDIIEKVGADLRNILQETLPSFQSLLSNPSASINMQTISDTAGRLFLRLSLLENTLQCSLLDHKLANTLAVKHHIRLKKLPDGEEFDLYLTVGAGEGANPSELPPLPELLRALCAAKKGDICELPKEMGGARYEVIGVGM